MHSTQAKALDVPVKGQRSSDSANAKKGKFSFKFCILFIHCILAVEAQEHPTCFLIIVHNQTNCFLKYRFLFKFINYFFTSFDLLRIKMQKHFPARKGEAPPALHLTPAFSFVDILNAGTRSEGGKYCFILKGLNEWL